MKPKPEPIADNPGARSDVSAALQPQADPWWLVLFRGLARQAAWATEADRGRAALLSAISHDLRAPLAAAKAAVTDLRSRDVRLTDDDREELLATAEESLDLLARLAASLLDVSRLQAGALAIFPRPADLGEIVADVLDGLGPQPRAVLADIPSGLEEVMADPAITERVIANLVPLCQDQVRHQGQPLPGRQRPAGLPRGIAAAGDGQDGRGPGGAARGRARPGHP